MRTDERERRALVKKLTPVTVENPEDINVEVKVDLRGKTRSRRSWGIVQYAKTFMMYVYEGMKPSEIVKHPENIVPLQTIREWIRRDSWLERKKAAEKDILTHLETEALQILKLHRTKVMLRHLDLGEDIDEHVMAVLKDHIRNDPDGEKRSSLSPEDLKDISSAFKNSADVQHRIVKVSEKQAEMVQQGNVFNGPININAAPAINGKTIDL